MRNAHIITGQCQIGHDKMETVTANLQLSDEGEGQFSFTIEVRSLRTSVIISAEELRAICSAGLEMYTKSDAVIPSSEGVQLDLDELFQHSNEDPENPEGFSHD